MNNSEIQRFFLNHLNTIFCVKAHLLERLPEIVDDLKFVDLKTVINASIAETETQIADLEKIYALLQTTHSLENCPGLISNLDNAFVKIQESSEVKLRNLLILSYLYYAKGTEQASFKVIKLLTTNPSYIKVKSLIEKINSDSDLQSPLISPLTEA